MIPWGRKERGGSEAARVTVALVPAVNFLSKYGKMLTCAFGALLHV